MTKSALAVLTLLLTLFLITAGNAQLTVEASKITCREFAEYKIADPDKIAIWLNGYYDGKRGNTSIDMVQLHDNVEKLEQYCLQNSEMLVIQAYEKLFGGGPSGDGPKR
jgi:acid stress chaperone HdeB